MFTSPYHGQVEHPTQIVRERGIVLQHAQVALEEAVIGGIETYQCHEETDVRLGEAIREEIGAASRKRTSSSSSIPNTSANASS